MQRILILLGCTLLCAPTQADDPSDLPVHIRVIVEYIVAPHEMVTEMMRSADSGPKLHARMRALVKEKKARIMETSIVTARSGQKATVESIMEYIYPTEYEPPSFPHSIPQQTDSVTPFPYVPRLRPGCPTAFETRNVGVTLEIEPTVGPNNKIVDLRFAPELVDLLRLETWVEHTDQWGDASIRHPTFESLRVSTGITLQAGKFGFVCLLTPKNEEGGRAFTRKILLFVRADVIPMESPDTLSP